MVLVDRVHAGGDMDQQLVIHRPGFDHQHAVLTAFAEPIGEYATRRPGAENNVIVFVLHARSIAIDGSRVNP